MSVTYNSTDIIMEHSLTFVLGDGNTAHVYSCPVTIINEHHLNLFIIQSGNKYFKFNV